MKNEESFDSLSSEEESSLPDPEALSSLKHYQYFCKMKCRVARILKKREKKQSIEQLSGLP